MYYDGITFTDKQEKAIKGIVNHEIKKQIMRFDALLKLYWKYYSFPSKFFKDYPHLKKRFDGWEADLSIGCEPMQSIFQRTIGVTEFPKEIPSNPETYAFPEYNDMECSCEVRFNLWLFKYLFNFKGGTK